MAARLIACPDCGAKVSSRATSCPQCGGPLGKRPAKRYGCGTLVLAGLGLLVIASFFAPRNSTSPPATVSAPSPAPTPDPAPSDRTRPAHWSAVHGDRVTLSSPQYRNVSLCADLDTYKEFDAARSIGNRGAVEDLHRSGRVARVPLPVSVIVEEVTLGSARVRITDGDFSGQTGWISKDRIDTE